MQRKKQGLMGVFIAVMLFFSLAMSAFVLLRAGLDAQLDDLRRSLETSQGRERKQQVEYDQVIAQLPLTQAELAEVQPKADAAAEETARLKEERKRLRTEKKELEAEASSGEVEAEGAGDS